jgi:hypothetical protein
MLDLLSCAGSLPLASVYVLFRLPYPRRNEVETFRSSRLWLHLKCFSACRNRGGMVTRRQVKALAPLEVLFCLPYPRRIGHTSLGQGAGSIVCAFLPAVPAVEWSHVAKSRHWLHLKCFSACRTHGGIATRREVEALAPFYVRLCCAYPRRNGRTFRSSKLWLSLKCFSACTHGGIATRRQLMALAPFKVLFCLTYAWRTGQTFPGQGASSGSCAFLPAVPDKEDRSKSRTSAG